MKIIAPLAAVAALFALSACNPPEPEVVDTNPDPMADQLANAAPVELPPSVKESVSYRCKDNSIVYVDILADGSANLRAEKTDIPTRVKAEEPGKTLTAEGGYSLSGTGETVEIAMKGGNAQSCKR